MPYAAPSWRVRRRARDDSAKEAWLHKAWRKRVTRRGIGVVNRITQYFQRGNRCNRCNRKKRRWGDVRAHTHACNHVRNPFFLSVGSHSRASRRAPACVVGAARRDLQPVAGGTSPPIFLRTRATHTPTSTFFAVTVVNTVTALKTFNYSVTAETAVLVTRLQTG
jgi:hypothetical protein